MQNERRQIQGTGLVGYTLTSALAVFSGEEPTTVTRQWERCNKEAKKCHAITGASASSYTLTEADAHSATRLLMSATNTHGTTEVLSAPIIASTTSPTDMSLA